MKLAGMIGTAVLSLTLGVAVPAFAQEHEQQEEQKAKPAQQVEKKAQPAKPEEHKAEPAKAATQETKSAHPQEKSAKQEEKPSAQRAGNGKQEEKAAQRSQPAKPEKQEQHTAANRGGGRIPDERFKANFGRQHTFHVSQSDYSGGRRFRYGGYSFGFVDAWPSDWLYTQDVFVIEINGVYYLCNPEYPGVNVALAVTL